MGLILHPGYPNPFKPSSTLSYSLPKDGHVRVAIIDLHGHEIALLVDEMQTGQLENILYFGKAWTAWDVQFPPAPILRTLDQAAWYAPPR